MDAVHTNVIKRNGEEVNFDLDKIVNAINAANKEVSHTGINSLFFVNTHLH